MIPHVRIFVVHLCSLELGLRLDQYVEGNFADMFRGFNTQSQASKTNYELINQHGKSQEICRICQASLSTIIQKQEELWLSLQHRKSREVHIL